MSGELDTAAEAIRAYLHRRELVEDPASVYQAIGALVSIVHRMAEVVDRASGATDTASRSDDGHYTTRVTRARENLALARGALVDAVELLEAAHSDISHLAWDHAREDDR